MINNIVDINLDLDHTVKWLVAFNHDWMIKTIEFLGGEQYLEDNQIFAVCFDTTPKDKIGKMRSYREVLDKYPNSNRVASKAFYIGDYDKEDWLDVVNECLENWSDITRTIFKVKHKYEIVFMEGGFTKYEYA